MQRMWSVSGEKNKIKVLPHKHNFSPALNDWGISPNNKRSSKQEKKYV